MRNKMNEHSIFGDGLGFLDKGTIVTGISSVSIPPFFTIQSLKCPMPSSPVNLTKWLGSNSPNFLLM